MNEQLKKDIRREVMQAGADEVLQTICMTLLDKSRGPSTPERKTKDKKQAKRVAAAIND